MKKLKYLIAIWSLFTIGFSTSVQAQNIVFDQCIDVEGLKLCPSVYNESQYYYLVNKIQLGKHPNGKPQFSFIKFIRESETPTGDIQEFTETNDVAGVVTALFVLEVSEEQKDKAERKLKRIKKNATIAGAIIPKSGTVSIVSSFAKADGEKVKTVVGLGQAPIMEGSKVAVSVYLTKKGADELWASFESPTPDFSFHFELDLEGYWDKKRITVEAEWDKIYSHKDFQAALATPVFSAEIRKTLDELKDRQILKVDIIGEDAALEKMLDAAYNKITNLMFEKIAGTGVMELNKLNPDQQKNMLDRATEALRYHRRETMDYNKNLAVLYKERAEFEEKARAKAQKRRDKIFEAQGKKFVEPDDSQRKDKNTPGKPVGGSYKLPQYQSVPGFSAAVSYVMKEIKQTGQLSLDFNKRIKDIRTESFSENLGSYINRSSCKECFKKVNLFDPAYQQHVIRARLDLNSFEDFKNYVNNVDVQLRKEHKNGTLTLKGISVDQRKFAKNTNEYVLQYGWNQDGESIEDRVKWLEYDYKIKWSFFGGHVFESEWTKGYNAASIELIPPLYRQRIDVEIYPDDLENVRAVELKVFYTINGKEQMERRLLKLNDVENISTSVYILQPPGQLEYEYQLNWFERGSNSSSSGERRKSTASLIMLDTML